MADASQALLGVGAGLTQSSQTLANAARLRQEEQLYGVKLQELQAQREERLYGQALQRVQMGINLPEANKNDYFLKGPGRKYINTVLGGEATDDVIKVFTSNKTRDKTEQVLTYLPELIKDPAKFNEVTQKIKGAISDPALAFDAINTLSDMVAKSQQSQKTTAEIRKLETEAQSPFGDPKFAYKQGFDQAKAQKDQADTALGEYRKQIGQLQQANRMDPRINDPAFQSSMKKQALDAAGISEAQLGEYDRISKTPYPELISQFTKQGSIQGAPATQEATINQPTGAGGDFGVLPTEAPKPISSEIANKVAYLQTNSIPAVEDLKNLVDSGDINKLKVQFKAGTNPSINRAVNAIKLGIGFTLSGANLGKNEEKTILNQSELGIFDSPESYTKALANLQTFMTNYVQSTADKNLTPDQKAEIVRAQARAVGWLSEGQKKGSVITPENKLSPAVQSAVDAVK